MKYTKEHADKALEIMERLLPHVSTRPEYSALIAILRDSAKWKEAHALFNKIRVNITLPGEKRKTQTLDDHFSHIAENAAKTAYNCSGEPAPFDDISFKRLLGFEQLFLKEMKKS